MNGPTDAQAIREILATIAIPPAYDFTCFAIRDHLQKLQSIHWRDIPMHRDEPIYIVLKSKVPEGASIFNWKLLECRVINTSMN